MVSTAFAAVVDAVAGVVEARPISGLQVHKIGDWNIALNATKETVKHDGEDMTPWSVRVGSDRYLAFAIFDPAGGIVGGISEDEFITEMQKLMPQMEDR